MAEAIIKNTKLKLLFESGINEKGEPVYRTKTYNNIKKDATAEQLGNAAQVLAELCELPLVGVEREDNFDIIM